MKRRNISGNNHRKNFQRGRNVGKVINQPMFMPRGGIRL